MWVARDGSRRIHQTLHRPMSAPAPAPVSGASDASDARPRPLVAVDLDEVLGAFVEALSLWHNEHHGTGAGERAREREEGGRLA